MLGIFVGFYDIIRNYHAILEKEGIIFGDLRNRRYICSEILTMYNLPKLPIGGIIRKKTKYYGRN